MPKVNSPGCGCCTPPCAYECPDATTENITEIEWDVTIPDYIEFWALQKLGGSSYRFYKYETTGWSAFDGTYIITRRTTPTCGWDYPTPQTETITLDQYTYDAEVLYESGSLAYYVCPTSTYTYLGSTLNYNAVSSASETGWSAFLTNAIGVPHGLVNPVFNQEATYLFGRYVLYGPFFAAYGAGPNNNAPCEAADLTWNVFDRFPVDARCSGTYTDYQATATITPTIV